MTTETDILDLARTKGLARAVDLDAGQVRRAAARAAGYVAGLDRTTKGATEFALRFQPDADKA